MGTTEAVSARQKKWAELIRLQEQSGLSVAAFCRKHDLVEQSFYNWRKKLGSTAPVRFALVAAAAAGTNDPAPIELILASGDRLRIGAGTDSATLRAVLGALRERA